MQKECVKCNLKQQDVAKFDVYRSYLREHCRGVRKVEGFLTFMGFISFRNVLKYVEIHLNRSNWPKDCMNSEIMQKYLHMFAKWNCIICFLFWIFDQAINQINFRFFLFKNYKQTIKEEGRLCLYNLEIYYNIQICISNLQSVFFFFYFLNFSLF